ncbi:hypothetical protein D9M72_351090 [compost metagenome]
MEDFLVGDVVEDVVARIVMDAQALLLDEGVVADGVDLKAGGERDRSERAMRRQCHVVGFRHRRDLAALGDAAGMRQIRLQDVDIAV